MSQSIQLSEIEPVTAKPLPALVRSMKENGFLPAFPVILLQGNPYCIVDGRRRVAAARNVGLASVLAVVREQGSPETTILAHATRSENPVAELQAIQQLMRSGLSEAQIARVGFASLQRIKRIAKLNRLTPEIAERVNNGEIAPGVAFQIAMLPVESQSVLAQEEKVTVGKVRQSRCVRREVALPGLESILAAPAVIPASIEEIFAVLSHEMLYAILAEIPQDERFALWRGKVQRELQSRAVPVALSEEVKVANTTN